MPFAEVLTTHARPTIGLPKTQKMKIQQFPFKIITPFRFGMFYEIVVSFFSPTMAL